jgi:hypothetical protein
MKVNLKIESIMNKILTNTQNDFVYVGKTFDNIYNRLNRHELDYGAWLNRGCRRSYVSSFEILRFDGYKIELIESVEDETLLSSREKYHINNTECINIRCNRNVSSPTFLCPCGEVVSSIKRYIHNKSSAHRKRLRELHSKTDSRHYFIKMYTNSKIVNTYGIENCITLDIPD